MLGRDEFRSIKPFLQEYKSSLTQFASTTLATICWITSSILGSGIVALLALSLHILPAATYYQLFKPFGITINYTPIRKHGENERVDKLAESRGEAIIDDGDCTIHGLVTIANSITSFGLMFEVPEELQVEFRDIPREEHDYDPEANTLTCETITDRKFSFVIDVFLTTSPGRPTDYPLRIIDMSTGKTLKKITILTHE